SSVWSRTAPSSTGLQMTPGWRSGNVAAVLDISITGKMYRQDKRNSGSAGHPGEQNPCHRGFVLEGIMQSRVVQRIARPRIPGARSLIRHDGCDPDATIELPQLGFLKRPAGAAAGGSSGPGRLADGRSLAPARPRRDPRWRHATR